MLPLLGITAHPSKEDGISHYLGLNLICIGLQKPCNPVIVILVNGNVVHDLKTGFLTHGLDLADDFTDKALLNQFRCQVGIQHHGQVVVLFRHISVLL